MPPPILPFERPVSAGEVLDAGVRLFKVSLVRCLPLSLAAVVLGQLPTVYALARGRRPSLSAEAGIADWALILLAGLGNLLLWGAILLRQRAIAEGRVSTVGADLSMALARLPASIGLGLLVLGGIALGMLLLVLPGIYLSIALMFAYPALLLEDAPVLAALRRSLELVRGNWWRTSMILVVAFFAIIVFYAVGSIFGLILLQLTGGGDVGSVFLVTSVIAALIGALFTPFMSALWLVQFAELKLRREGVDLASRIESLPGR